MNNPYEVLGVPRTATNDEVKKAYRQLCKKYHPDSYVNNPLADLAEEKFKEVQTAYEQIMKERENGGYSYDSNGQSRTQATGGNQETVELQAARNYINARRFREALNVLANIGNRSAMWYYYSAIAHSGLGNNVAALEHARRAAALEPDNMSYRSLVQQFESGGTWYEQRQATYGYPSFGGGSMCLRMCIANMICNMCCLGGGCCGGRGMYYY